MTVLSAPMRLKYCLEEERMARRFELGVLDSLNRGFHTGDIYSAGNVCTSYLKVFISEYLL